MLADCSTAKQSPALAHLNYTKDLCKKQESCCHDSDAADKANIAAHAGHQPEQPPPAFSGFMLANSSKARQLSVFAQQHARKVLQDQQLSCHVSGEAAGSAGMTPHKAENEQQQPLFAAPDLANSLLQRSAHTDPALDGQVPQAMQEGQPSCNTASQATCVAAGSAQPENQPVRTMAEQAPGNGPVQLSAPAYPDVSGITHDGQGLVHPNSEATETADAAGDEPIQY